MANPRQRRKAQSSSHRPVSHSKHAKRALKKMPTIRGPKVLQDIWDERKTIKQNYAALGLLDSLSPLASGGVENLKNHETLIRPPPENLNPNDTNVLSARPSIPHGFGRIIRDRTGEVIRIEVDEEEKTLADEKDSRIGMEQLDPVVDANMLAKWSIGGSTTTASRERSNEHISNSLEKMSTPQTASRTLSFALSGIGPRYASAAEISYLQKLVNKYGNDVDQMVRDHRLNPDQRTPGQLRSALRRAGLYA